MSYITLDWFWLLILSFPCKNSSDRYFCLSVLVRKGWNLVFLRSKRSKVEISHSSILFSINNHLCMQQGSHEGKKLFLSDSSSWKSFAKTTQCEVGQVYKPKTGHPDRNHVLLQGYSSSRNGKLLASYQ